MTRRRKLLAAPPRMTAPASSNTDDLTALDRILAGVLIHAVLRPAGLLPVGLRAAIGRTLGGAAGRLARRERRIAELQLARLLPDQNEAQIARRVFAGLGETLCEAINLNPLLAQAEQRLDCPNRRLAETIAQRGRPVIALTAHTGNWELLAAYMVALGVPLATVGRQARGRLLQLVLAHLRARYGVRTLWRAGRSGLRELAEELRPGRVIAALIDQDTYVRSEAIPFFGMPARTPSGLVEFGKKHDALFVTAFIVRTAHGRYRIQVEEIDPSLPTTKILAVVNQRLEDLLRHYPEQWVWFHKRWRGRADGTRMSSAEYVRFLSEKSGS